MTKRKARSCCGSAQMGCCTIFITIIFLVLSIIAILLLAIATFLYTETCAYIVEPTPPMTNYITDKVIATEFWPNDFPDYTPLRNPPKGVFTAVSTVCGLNNLTGLVYNMGYTNVLDMPVIMNSDIVKGVIREGRR